LCEWDRRLDEQEAVYVWHELQQLECTLASYLTGAFCLDTRGSICIADIIIDSTPEATARAVVACVARHTNRPYVWVSLEHPDDTATSHTIVL
jgi:hypothetical protein